MRHALAPVAILLAPLLSLAPPTAAGSAKGEALHEQHCLRCHGPEVYTRKDRKVTSRAGLDRQVQRCELALGLHWFDDEIADVATYLDTHHYHFER